MKWERVVLVCYGLNDKINHEAASGWKRRYDIPADLELHKKGEKLSDKHRVKVVKWLGNASPIGLSKRYGTKRSGCTMM